MNTNTPAAIVEAPPPSHLEQTHFQVHQFVDALFDPSDILEFRVLPCKQSRWTIASTLDEVLPWLMELNTKGQSIYVGCNPRACKGDGSRAKGCTGCGRCVKCVSVCRSLCIDIENTELTEFTVKFKQCGLPAPTVTLTSGGGIHCYWRLDDDLQPEQWSGYQQGVIQATATVDLQVDRRIKDPPRVMRVPGFVNHRRHKPAKLISVTKEATYSLDEFPAPLETIHEKSSGKSLSICHGSERDIVEARECLDRLASWRCNDYGSWINVGMALHAIRNDEQVLQIWHDWSKSSQKYNGEQDCRQHWDSFSAGGNGTGRLGIGSLVHWGREDSQDEGSLKWEPIPATALPPCLREMSDAVATSMGVDPAGFILPALSVAASAVGSSRVVRPKAGWEMVPIIWTAILSYSGGKKSPPFHAAVNVLRIHDDASCEEHAAAMKQYEHDLSEHQKHFKASKPFAPTKPDKPVCERHHTSVATLQAIHKILSDNPRGICVANDELSGWINAMDPFTTAKGADLSNWLELFNGHGTTVDRAGKEPMRIPRTSVNVTGTITRGQWRQSMSGANASNGLAPRFLIAMPPKKYQRWTAIGIDPCVAAKYDTMVHKMLGLPPAADGKPIMMGWTGEAALLWKAFFDENVECQERETDGYLESVYAKLEGQAARLALVLQMMRWTGDQSLSDTEIDAQSMRMAIELTRWFRREAKRVSLISNQVQRSDDEDKVFEYLASHNKASVRDLRRNLMRTKSSAYVKGVVKRLVSAGRLEEVVLQGKGRPSRCYVVR